jgi:drug/metabolite transporter (DMT)-like permease
MGLGVDWEFGKTLVPFNSDSCSVYPTFMAVIDSTPVPGGSPSPRAYVLAFATVYLVWGSTYLAIRVAVESMPPFALAAVRFALAGALLMTVLRARGAAWPTAGQWRAAAVSGFFLLLGGNGLVTWAERSVPSGVTALLIGSGPLFVVLVEWAWPGGSRPRPLTAIGMLLGFAGVAWLAAPWQNAGAESLPPAGVAAILIACVSWAIGAIYGRHVHEPAPPFTAAAAQMLAGSVSLALVALVRGEFAGWDIASTTVRSWTAFAYLVLVGSLAGYSAFVWLVKHASPAQTATYAYVNPVVAVFLGWLLLGEPVGPRTLAASAVILGAVVIVTLGKKRKRDV